MCIWICIGFYAILVRNGPARFQSVIMGGNYSQTPHLYGNQSVQSGKPVYRLLISFADYDQSGPPVRKRKIISKLFQSIIRRSLVRKRSKPVNQSGTSPEITKCEQHTFDHGERSWTSPEVWNQSATSPENGSYRAQSAWKSLGPIGWCSIFCVSGSPWVPFGPMGFKFILSAG